MQQLYCTCRFDAFGLSPEALFEAYSLARLTDSASSSTLALRSTATAEDAAAAARRNKRAALASAGRARSAGGATVAPGMQQLAAIGNKSGNSVIVDLAQAAVSSPGSFKLPGYAAMLPEELQQQQQQQSSSGPAAAGQRALIASTTGGMLGHKQQTVPPLPLGQSPEGGRARRYASSCCSPTAAVALQHHRGLAAAVAGDEQKMQIGAGIFEPSEVLAVLFDSSKQLIITGGNTGAIRVSVA